ncbi:MAG: PAS domain S-box protein [Negativicutes bacterium]|nr:PAS domain S-box protein [Negativicutes bacterium]
MERVGQYFREWILPAKSIVTFGFILLVLVWATALWQVDQDRTATIETVINDGDKFARAFEEHVRQVLKTHDQYLLLMKKEYEGARAVTPALTRLMVQIGQDPLVIQLAVEDKNGYMLASFYPSPAGINFADRPHFQAHRDTDTNKLYIGQPFMGRVTGMSSVPLSRRLSNPDGSFAGIVYVSISPEYFNNFYRAMNFNEDYIVRVLGLDGYTRASNSGSELGRDMAAATVFQEINKAPAGVYHSLGQFLGKKVLMSYRQMSDYPLIVQVGVSESTLAPMLQRRYAYLGAAGGVSFFIVVFSGSLMLQARRRRQADKRLQESYEQLSATHEELTVSEDELRRNYNELNNERVFSNAVLESVPGLLYLYDAEGRLVRWNKNHESATGYTAGELSTMTLNDWYRDDEETLARITWAVEKAFQNGEAKEEAELQTKEGRRIPFYLTAVKMVLDNKPYIVGIGIDVTERKKAEAELREKERLLQESFEELTASHEELTAGEEELRLVYSEVVAANSKLSQSNRTIEEIFNASGDGFVVNDPENGAILAVNRRMTEMFGFSEEEFKQQGIVLISTPALKEEALARIRKTVNEGIQVYERETADRNGRRMVVEINSSPAVIDGKTCCLALMRDVTDRKQMEARIEFLSLHDSLTGVYNRTFFEEELLRLQTRNEQAVGMFVCDVDGLKLINDTLGHRQGDELLKNVARLLAAHVKEPDFVARIGGDEFAVLLFAPTHEEMQQLETRYRNTVEEYNLRTPHLPLSLSLGWSVAAAANIDQTFKQADNNMYRQKMHQSQSVRSAIVGTMMKALEARDHITEGHADRLENLMERMGRRLRLPQADLADLRLFAKFHDIGKVGIPDSILNKPGKLTAEEYAVMQRHCEIGFRIARASPDLAPIADWVLKHQEHWNGNGYPLGLSGAEIPIQCRMLGIIDAYDAMTSDRPYRQAMRHEDAIEEIRRYAGIQFDPRLAEEFIAMMRVEIN